MKNQIATKTNFNQTFDIVGTYEDPTWCVYYIADQTETIFYSELLGSSGKQTYTFNFTYHFEGWQYFGFYYGKLNSQDLLFLSKQIYSK